MCRNYDAGECAELECFGRITCRDFNDGRCADHSINGHWDWGFDDDDARLPDPSLGIRPPADFTAASAWENQQ